MNGWVVSYESDFELILSDLSILKGKTRSDLVKIRFRFCSIRGFRCIFPSTFLLPSRNFIALTSHGIFQFDYQRFAQRAKLFDFMDFHWKRIRKVIKFRSFKFVNLKSYRYAPDNFAYSRIRWCNFRTGSLSHLRAISCVPRVCCLRRI